MKEMRDLDETDVRILELLVEDGRRSYSDIAEDVGMTGPAVSSRVDRLEEQGIIRGFTVDVDRSLLRDRQPVAIELDASPGCATDVFDAARGLNGVETAIKTHDGRIICYANAPERSIDEWLGGGIDFEDVAEYHIRFVDDLEQNRDVSRAMFALECPECGSAVGDDGVTTAVGGRIYTFCCPSCRDNYEERYRELERGTENG